MNPKEREIVVIAHDIRSSHNIGSLLRTADGLGIKHLYITGYSPYPLTQHDKRLPHIAQKVHAQIQKTALGAEDSVSWRHVSNITMLIEKLTTKGYDIIALEQHKDAQPLPEYQPNSKIAIILGNEVSGVSRELIEYATKIVEIPMYGRKESFNVTQAAAMIMYHCRFYPF